MLNQEQRKQATAKFTSLAAHYETSDREILSNVLVQIQQLEDALVKKAELEEAKRTTDIQNSKETAIDKFNKDNQIATKLKEELKAELNANDKLEWNLYAESIALARTLTLQDIKKRKLSDSTKEELRLLTASIAFSIKVTLGTPLNETEKANAAKIGEDINKILQPSSKEAADKEIKALEKRKRWLKFAFALGIFIIVATVVATITLMVLFPPLLKVAILAYYLGLFTGVFAGIATATAAGAVHMNANVTINKLTNPDSQLNRFYRSVEKHAKNKNVIDAPVAPISTPKK